MNFANNKKQALEKLSKADKSKKGSVDKQIVSLIKLLNKHKDYYTTSSCAGRIMILKPGNKKHQTKWLLVSHDPVKSFKLKPSKEMTWFRYEPLILHICCRTIDDAKKLMKITSNSAFKHSGIISIKNKIIFEIVGIDYMDIPLTKDNKELINENYLKIVISEANKKLKLNLKRIKEFEKEIRKLFLSQQQSKPDN